MARTALFILCLIAIASLASADKCSTYSSSCSACTNGHSNDGTSCRWCLATSECVSRTIVCSRPSSLAFYPSQCPRTTAPVYSPRPTPAPACTAYSCSSCISQSQCGWCESLSRCMPGTISGASPTYCPVSSFSSWRWSSCSAPTPYRSSNHRSVTAIFIVTGVIALVAGVAMLIIVCIRRRHQRASQDITSFEMGPTEDYAIDDAPTSSPAFGNALPGYLYTTSSSDASQPQYVYTAVPVGPVVSHIPQ